MLFWSLTKFVGFSLAWIAVAVTVWLVRSIPTQAGDGSLPPDVIAFVGRRASCHEWSQKTVDPQQAAQVEKIVRSLRCTDIKTDELALRKSYANNPSVIAALNATWSKTVERLPIEPPPPDPPGGPHN